VTSFNLSIKDEKFIFWLVFYKRYFIKWNFWEKVVKFSIYLKNPENIAEIDNW